MRASAAIAAIVVEARRCAPRHPRPSVFRSCPGSAAISISGPLRDAAAPPFGEVGAGGAEFGRRWRWSWRRTSCGGPPFQCGDQSGRAGSEFRSGRTPVALRIALAIAGEVGTVATSPMPTLPPSTWSKPPSSKCTSIARRVGDAGNAVVLHACASGCRRSADRFRALRRARSRCPGSPSPPPGCARAQALRSCRPQFRYER